MPSKNSRRRNIKQTPPKAPQESADDERRKDLIDQVINITTGYTCDMCNHHGSDYHEFHFLTGHNDKMLPICHRCMIEISKVESEDPAEKEFVAFAKKLVDASQDTTTTQVDSGKFQGVILDE